MRGLSVKVKGSMKAKWDLLSCGLWSWRVGVVVDHISSETVVINGNLLVYDHLNFMHCYSQTKSSVPVASKLMNSLMEK